MTDFPYEPQRFLARFSLGSWASASAISPSVPASSRPPATGAIFTPMWAPGPPARRRAEAVPGELPQFSTVAAALRGRPLTPSSVQYKYNKYINVLWMARDLLLYAARMN